MSLPVVPTRQQKETGHGVQTQPDNKPKETKKRPQSKVEFLNKKKKAHQEVWARACSCGHKADPNTEGEKKRPCDRMNRPPDTNRTSTTYRTNSWQSRDHTYKIDQTRTNAHMNASETQIRTCRNACTHTRTHTQTHARKVFFG